MSRLKPWSIAASIGAALLLAASSASAETILFVGNSFTFAAYSPVWHYRSTSVTDLNGEGVGGVERRLGHRIALLLSGAAGLATRLLRSLGALPDGDEPQGEPFAALALDKDRPVQVSLRGGLTQGCDEVDATALAVERKLIALKQ